VVHVLDVEVDSTSAHTFPSTSFATAPCSQLPVKLTYTSIGTSGYEAFHGGPREAAGYDRGNPLPLLLPAIDLLEGVGQAEAARRVAGAVARVLTEKKALTPDLGGKATTTQMAETLVAALG
jgi:isocitrate/isopropylmalate dehydrogenase